MQLVSLETIVLRSHSDGFGFVTRTAAEVVERLAGLFAFAVTFPILFLAAGIIAIVSGRSPFIAHQRVGRGGAPIWVLKLRTIWGTGTDRKAWLVESIAASESCPVIPPELKGSLVTSRFAALCRRYSIDELPQFWNIARGEMGFVGPRPITPYELRHFYGTAAARVLSVKPGLSGLWQISGRSRLGYSQRRRLDLFMVSHWSLPLYLRILAVTVPKVLAGKDAW